ncbi:MULTISPECIES: GNAT family N-acetyltransferase [Burkholderia]|uniref:GNAT family acetyltransferase n=1 Tax=Burkholderia savannae TaxID=1637837 RepID=A0ABR5T3Q4_9BURK|nr:MULTISPECIES: GNAT family N-acetyltransferase [Burkholderia]AOJ71019.1 GNAT family acetyltransferase [Burkholderia savannae]AOJ84365.1 GNAT family acetyltransferase [Burkholderia savannae]AOK49411.1 GNAT family acetyltransferase [Burkholderia sp. MSMB617WGS]KGS08301.1 acetyltransferase family protein [Burkholderia sp. ABCPW 111]KVG48917.1 GNAT family acetyltransferase [Burkholderia sp. MSMB0265]
MQEHVDGAVGRSAPVIETVRLILSGHRLDDFDSSRALWADPDVTRLIREEPYTMEECWFRLLRYVGHWRLLGFGYWTVHEKQTGRFIGELGFADAKRDIVPALDNVPELGGALSPAAWGTGVAREALYAVLDWADEHLAARRTVCLIGPENRFCIRLAGEFGYREIAATEYKGQPILLFERPACEPRNRNDRPTIAVSDRDRPA